MADWEARFQALEKRLEAQAREHARNLEAVKSSNSILTDRVERILKILEGLGGGKGQLLHEKEDAEVGIPNSDPGKQVVVEPRGFERPRATAGVQVVADGSDVTIEYEKEEDVETHRFSLSLSAFTGREVKIGNRQPEGHRGPSGGGSDAREAWVDPFLAKRGPVGGPERGSQWTPYDREWPPMGRRFSPHEPDFNHMGRQLKEEEGTQGWSSGAPAGTAEWGQNEKRVWELDPIGEGFTAPETRAGNEWGRFFGGRREFYAGRGFGNQDVWLDERPSYEARTSSMPLPQRPVGDDSVTLGPQGGLGRGMSIRGLPGMSSAPMSDVPFVAAESRRMAAGLNGYAALSDRTTSGVMGGLMPRHTTKRTAAPAAYEFGSQERNVNLGNGDLRNSDRSFERSLATSSRAQGRGTVVSLNEPLEKALLEDQLRNMSLSTIKEFYSARDEKEVELCIKDLNSPGFHPSMVSLWVTDSFERKDMERDLLAKLLVNLTKSQDGVLTQPQLSRGFEYVLATLEDAVMDAPRAAEFLGRIFAKVITENVISLGEIGMLIRNGGEEPGHLVEVGLAADVLGSTLEIIKSEKGDEVLSDMRRSSKLRLEDFRPLYPNGSRKLEKFI